MTKWKKRGCPSASAARRSEAIPAALVRFSHPVCQKMCEVTAYMDQPGSYGACARVVVEQTRFSFTRTGPGSSARAERPSASNYV